MPQGLPIKFLVYHTSPTISTPSLGLVGTDIGAKKIKASQNVTLLFSLLWQSSGNDCFGGATVDASCTVDASVGVDGTLGIALTDDANRTFVQACTTVDASVSDNVRHWKHLHKNCICLYFITSFENCKKNFNKILGLKSAPFGDTCIISKIDRRERSLSFDFAKIRGFVG